MVPVTLQEDIILPGAAELVWGAFVFVLVAGAVIFLVIRAVGRRSSRDEVDHWRERALRAEAERDALRARRDRGDA